LHEHKALDEVAQHGEDRGGGPHFGVLMCAAVEKVMLEE
jgi:hypothetical protein